MQYERQIAKRAIDVFKGISLRVEIEETITASPEGYTHILTPYFYRDNHKKLDTEMEEQIITSQDDAPLAQKSLQIVLEYLISPPLKKVIQDHRIKIQGPTKYKAGKSNITLTRKL